MNHFEHSYTDEPHATRRKEILKAHPEVLKLAGPDSRSKFIVMFVMCVHLLICYWIVTAPTAATTTIVSSHWKFFIICYIVGGTCSKNLQLALHEISHNLMFKKRLYNQIFGIFTNLPLGIPVFSLFRLYHRDHHKFQGLDGRDVDLPTEWEGRIFHNSLGKLCWIVLQPLFYGLRPLIVHPIPLTDLTLINALAQIIFDICVYRFIGWKGLKYLILSTFLGMGLHPMAGHVVAEHTTFVKGCETYSYYGPLNWLTYNVGYHNEHHDFPYIAGLRLPELSKIAPEFYSHLPHHHSWVKVIYDYIFDESISPFSRVKRSRKSY
jgi:sphingolipid delta-4 desaturase